MVRLRQNVRDVLRCVTRCVPRRHQCLAESELIALLQLLVFELVFRATLVARENICGVQPRLQLTRTAHQIGVNVRLEDVRNRHLRFASHIDVNIDVRAWIENGCDAFIVVAEKIRELRDSFGLNGLEDERHRRELTRRRDQLQDVALTNF